MKTSTAEKPDAYVHQLPISAIDLSQTEAQKLRRETFDADGLKQLAESIKAQGVIQPITVRSDGKARFELVCGERRLIAAKKAGLDAVPCVVRDLTDQQVIEVQVVENLQREGLHAMQEAEAYEQLKRGGRTADEIAEMVGMSKAYVYARIKLLDLCPELRKAFYAGRFMESVALLLARIPTPEIQKQAFDYLTPSYLPKGDTLSFREAKRVIHERYMTRLADAPFDTKDATLVPAAGSCGKCPKRSGNDRQLFEDVQGADVCTDTACFASKRRAHGDRLIEEAKAKEQPVIVGPQAKKLLKFGLDSSQVDGYANMNLTHWINGKEMKVSTIVGKGAPVTLIQDPETGDVGRFVDGETFARAFKEKGGLAPRSGASSPGRASTESARRKKAVAENKYRAGLFAALREKMPKDFDSDDVAAMTEALWDALWHEYRQIVAKQWPDLKLDTHASNIGARIEKLGHSDLYKFARDLTYVNEIKVGHYDDRKPTKMETAARRLKIDTAAVRREAQKKPERKAKAAKAEK